MDSFKVQSNGMYWLFVVLIPILMIATGIGWLWIYVLQPNHDVGPLLFDILWWGLMIFGVYKQATMPHTIEFMETGDIRFIGAFRTLIIALSEITLIRTYAGPIVKLKYTKGNLLMLHQFTGFY